MSPCMLQIQPHQHLYSLIEVMPVQMFDGPKKKANLRMNTSSSSTRWFHRKDKLQIKDHITPQNCQTCSQTSFYSTLSSKNATWKVEKCCFFVQLQPDSLAHLCLRQAIQNRNSYYLPSWHMTLRPTALGGFDLRQIFFSDQSRQVNFDDLPIDDMLGQ